MATHTAITAPGHVHSGGPAGIRANGTLGPQPDSPSTVTTPSASTTRRDLVPKRPYAAAEYPVTYVLAFDIEKTGQRTDKNSMVAIGGCVRRVWDAKVVSTFLRFMKVEPGHDFSPHCKEDYWYNWLKFPMNKVVLECIEKEGVSPQQGIRDFADWLDGQERHYEAREERLKVVVDTVGSDTMWVSHYFQKYLDRGPIEDQYGVEGRYRSIDHSTAYARGLAGDDHSRDINWRRVLIRRGVGLPSEEEHNHMPDSDARYIAGVYLQCLCHAYEFRKFNEKVKL